MDRTNPLNDIAVYSATIPTIHDDEDKWTYFVKINEAILELKHRSGGSVHLKMVTHYSNNFNLKELPPASVINIITYKDKFPLIKGKRIGIFVGNHTKWDNRLTKYVDKFCEQYNTIVLCDHTSNYHGKCKIMASLIMTSLITFQSNYDSPIRHLDLLIDIGNI